MADGRILSESDYEKLQQLFERERRRQGNPRSRSPHSDEIDFLPPEVYVARVPTGGIAPTSAGTGTGTGDDIEGVDCDIYRMVFTGDHTGRLVSANFQRTVYNPFIARVPAGWALVARDKYGIWYCSASNAGDDDEPPVDLTGPGGGSCALARIKSTDCILATGPLNAVTMTGGGPWTSTGFKYLDVTDGTIVATWNTTTGFLDVTVDGMILMNCGNGCYTGGPLTGHVRSGTDTTDVCEGEVFTVCLTCTCCPTGIWDGPGWYCVNVLTDGTGTGTTAGYCEALELNDSHKCDPDIIICSGKYNSQAEAEAACGTYTCLEPAVAPATLTATMTVTGGGSCSADDGMIWSMVNDGVTTPLFYSGTAVADGGDIGVQIHCIDGVWDFQSTGFVLCQFRDSGATPFNLDDGVVISTSPLHVRFTGQYGGGLCTNCGGTFVDVQVDVQE